MAINLFGVTPESLKIYLPSLGHTPASTVEARLTAMILTAASVVSVEASTSGVDYTTTDTGNPVFHILQQMVVCHTLDQWTMSSSPSLPDSTGWHEKYVDYRTTLRSMPSRIDDSSNGVDRAKATTISASIDTFPTDGLNRLRTTLTRSSSNTRYIGDQLK
jgi:hypothetical protein